MIKRLKLLKKEERRKKTLWFLAQEQVSRQFYVVTETCDMDLGLHISRTFRSSMAKQLYIDKNNARENARTLKHTQHYSVC